MSLAEQQLLGCRWVIRATYKLFRGQWYYVLDSLPAVLVMQFLPQPKSAQLTYNFSTKALQETSVTQEVCL